MEAKEPGSHPQDPAAERDAGRKAITIKELAERFDKEHIAIRVKASTGKEYRRNLQQFILPALGQLTVTGVTRADVAKFHHDLRHIPYQANRCLEVISKMFSLSEMWGLRPDGTNPRKHIRKYPEEKRERFLSAAELRRLRAGNVGTADGALDVILDVVDRARKSFCDVAMVRIDAGFPSATLLAGLEARGIDYVSRLRANLVLDRLAEPCLKRPPGRRPAEPRSWLYELRYQADSWDKPRRVILVVKERADDLLLDRFFLVTSLGWTAKTRDEVLAHYRERGKAEGHMGELKDVLAPALSSANRAKSHWRGKTLKSKTPAVDAFACNEVRLLIACLAYQVMHIARRAMAKATGTGWSLRRLRERVLRAGARLVISGRRMTLALSSAAAPYWSALWPRLMALHWADPDP